MALTTPVLAGIVLAVLVGVTLGLLGGGGSMLTVPILVYLIGIPAHEAVAVSLVVVGATSLAALVMHARAGHVRWKTGVLFGATSMAGAYGAGRFAHLVPATVLLLLFGGTMLVAAAAMMRGRRALREGGRSELPVGAIPALGLAVGMITGLVGAGGGFIVVPALVLLGGLPMRVAVGTSLLVITMNSSAGLAGHLARASVDASLAAALTSAAIVGSVAGGTLAGRVPQALLRCGFAWFLVAIAVFILVQELPRALGVEVELATAWPLVLGVTAVPMTLGLIDLARRARLAAA